MAKQNIIRIPPQDRDGPIEQTQFYQWLGSRFNRTLEQPKLTTAVMEYLSDPFEVNKLSKFDIKRMQEIWENFWYEHYNGVESQTYIQ